MDVGRRERKKQLTRQAISDVATGLFIARGFDAVSVAEVAAAADVAVQTVFNHFPTKEDLFFDETDWWVAPARALRAAPPGEHPFDTLERQYREVCHQRATSWQLVTWPRFYRTLAASPALLARQRQLAQRMEDDIVAALHERDPDLPDLTAQLIAAQYAAAQKVLEAELLRRLPDQHPSTAAARRAVAAVDTATTEVFTALRRAYP